MPFRVARRSPRAARTDLEAYHDGFAGKRYSFVNQNPPTNCMEQLQVDLADVEGPLSCPTESERPQLRMRYPSGGRPVGIDDAGDCFQAMLSFEGKGPQEAALVELAERNPHLTASPSSVEHQAGPEED